MKWYVRGMGGLGAFFVIVDLFEKMLQNAKKNRKVLQTY
jgi:hypothetical protein